MEVPRNTYDDSAFKPHRARLLYTGITAFFVRICEYNPKKHLQSGQNMAIINMIRFNDAYLA